MRAAIVIAALSLTAPSMAQDVSGFLPTCLACHGKNGTSSVPTVPSLGAMPVNYVLTQLYLFREKLRVADPMNAMTAGLTDDDLRALGDVFNKMPAPLPAAALSASEQETASALISQYHCNSCHGSDLGGQQTIPRIAGQHAEYVRQALVDYKSNARRGYSPAMNEAAQEIKDDEIPLLARYVASFKAPE